jgi:hypothetical protein
MVRDKIINKITLSTSNGSEGELVFSYLQDIDNIGGEFAQPRRQTSMRVSSEGISWLLELIRNN